MEKIDDAPPGVYQMVYSNNLKQGQRESILDDPVAEAIIITEDLKNEWLDEPKQLLID